MTKKIIYSHKKLVLLLKIILTSITLKSKDFIMEKTREAERNQGPITTVSVQDS